MAQEDVNTEAERDLHSAGLFEPLQLVDHRDLPGLIHRLAARHAIQHSKTGKHEHNESFSSIT